MTNTELNHGAHAINILIDAMVKAVGDEYDVAEIEGDAVLLVRKGDPPSKKEILNTCIRIFNEFHFTRKWMQLHTVCPCGACQAIIDLTLKFVVHHGPVAEIKVGRFVKQSGPEMIVAHRLLKNSIHSNEYLLMTEKLLKQIDESSEPGEMEWNSSSEEYASIGKVDYRFALLNSARKNVPDPPTPEGKYRIDDTSYFEIPVAANFRDIYMILMNIPGRVEWEPGLQKVEQDLSDVFIGSIHRCTFKDFEAIISPVRMTYSDEGMVFAESWQINDRGLNLVFEYVFKKVNELTSVFSSRFINTEDAPIPEDSKAFLFNRLKGMASGLKGYCEEKKLSFFDPAFQKG